MNDNPQSTGWVDVALGVGFAGNGGGNQVGGNGGNPALTDDI